MDLPSWAKPFNRPTIALTLLSAMLVVAFVQTSCHCLEIAAAPAGRFLFCPEQVLAMLLYTAAATAASLLAHEAGHGLVAWALLGEITVRICPMTTVVQPQGCQQGDSMPGRAAIVLAGVAHQAAFVGILCGLAQLWQTTMMHMIASVQAVLLAGYLLLFWARAGQDGAVLAEMWQRWRRTARDTQRG